MRLDLNADADEALVLLAQLGARTRLLAHHALVLQAADAISLALNALAVPHDAQWLRMGAALHDAGKILHPHEEHGPGTAHEAAGQALLLKQGVPAQWASCCVSHGAWQTPGLALEPCSVALADHLWRGARPADLELRVIDLAAERAGCSRWQLFGAMDDAFEAIAAEGPARLRGGRSAQRRTLSTLEPMQ